jgi:hypothetical protein
MLLLVTQPLSQTRVLTFPGIQRHTTPGIEVIAADVERDRKKID